MATHTLVLLACCAVVILAPASAAQSRELCPATVTAIDASARKTLASGAPGVVVGVARAGEPVLLRAHGTANLEHDVPVRPATVFKLASVTKQFTAAAVLRLMEEGRLKLEDRLSRFVPQLPHADRVTLYQLLVQTSGIPDYSDDPIGTKSKSVARTADEMVAWIARLTPSFQFEPGTRWAYSNSNYALLGVVIERASGKPLEAVFDQYLFRPAGLRSTALDDPADVVAHRAQGYRRDRKAASGFANADWISPTIPGAAGGLRTTVEDLLQWSDALFTGRILQAASLHRMISPGRLDDGRTTKLGMPEAWQRGLNSDYGMGVFVTETKMGPRISHGGDIDGFSTWLAHYPDAGVTIAIMQNSESASVDSQGIEEAVFAQAGPECRSPMVTDVVD